LSPSTPPLDAFHTPAAANNNNNTSPTATLDTLWV